MVARPLILLALVLLGVTLVADAPQRARAAPVMNDKIAFTKSAVGDSNLEIYVIDADGLSSTS